MITAFNKILTDLNSRIFVANMAVESSEKFLKFHDKDFDIITHTITILVGLERNREIVRQLKEVEKNVLKIQKEYQ